MNDTDNYSISDIPLSILNKRKRNMSNEDISSEFSNMKIRNPGRIYDIIPDYKKKLRDRSKLRNPKEVELIENEKRLMNYKMLKNKKLESRLGRRN